MAESPTQQHSLTRAWRIRGQVQGVGFRPFVHRLAAGLGLSGFVRNDTEGVLVEVRGFEGALDEFIRRIESDAPVLARVDELLQIESCLDEPGEPGFRIERSDASAGDRGGVTVDAAVCDDCAREIFDPQDRRHGHALVNCTNCGPRYTIVRDLPYDRDRTTMAGFPMCGACAAEYADPADRRFHAQPVCCPDCGPRVRLVLADGEEAAGDVFAEAADLLRRGGVLALKGLGGYHLAADAGNETAVASLRERKGRDAKPLALMVRDLPAVRRLVLLSLEAERLLESPASPIVLAPRRPEAPVAAAVAPGNHRLGVMLPYTPVHHLLLARFEDPLVMTSFNRSDAPLVTDDEEGLRGVGTICDALLIHDRPIERAVDDSVLIDAPAGLLPVRRARGFVPGPLSLPVDSARPGLAVGGMLKGTVAVVRDREALLSQHLGDLDHAPAYRRFLETIRDLERLFDVRPEWIAADLHPAYPSHRYAVERAAAQGLDLIFVQHHHAHLAALLAEHGHTGTAVGVVCDGVGYGEDGTAWGGEILKGDLGGSERLGRLRPLLLPGGDAAAIETGRCALSWLFDLLGDAGFDHPLARRALPDDARRIAVAGMLQAGSRCPGSSGLGRLFDACASLLGLVDRNRYEAESGMRLEAAATGSEWAGGAARGGGIIEIVEREGLLEMDHRPFLDELLGMLDREADAGQCARFFHDAVADGLARVTRRIAERAGVGVVGLTGGVFCNTLLTTLVSDRLREAGLEVLVHRAVPPNDGAVAYGQAAAAAARLSGR